MSTTSNLSIEDVLRQPEEGLVGQLKSMERLRVVKEVDIPLQDAPRCARIFYQNHPWTPYIQLPQELSSFSALAQVNANSDVDGLHDS